MPHRTSGAGDDAPRRVLPGLRSTPRGIANHPRKRLQGRRRVISSLSGGKRGSVTDVHRLRWAGRRPFLRPGGKRRLPLAQGLALSPPGPGISGLFGLKARNRLQLSRPTQELKRAPSPSGLRRGELLALGAAAALRTPRAGGRSRSRRIGAWPAGETAPPPRCPQVPRYEPGHAPGPHTPGGASRREGASQLRGWGEGGENSRCGLPHWWERVPIFAASQSDAADDSGGQPCCPSRSKRRPEARPGADRPPNR